MKYIFTLIYFINVIYIVIINNIYIHSIFILKIM